MPLLQANSEFSAYNDTKQEMKSAYLGTSRKNFFIELICFVYLYSEYSVFLAKFGSEGYFHH